MIGACHKCGATNDAKYSGLNPCHLRIPAENHAFVFNDAGISDSIINSH
jgi:hypothetical protein